jgi:hypothetical protein
MVSSVCHPSAACHSARPVTDFRPSALPQAASAVGHAMTGQEVFLIVIIILALVASVVLTAMWSGKDRRKAALDVLDRFLR